MCGCTEEGGGARRPVARAQHTHNHPHPHPHPHPTHPKSKQNQTNQTKPNQIKIKSNNQTIKQSKHKQKIPGLEVWFQRASDVVRKLRLGDIDLGIVGLDMLLELGDGDSGERLV